MGCDASTDVKERQQYHDPQQAENQYPTSPTKPPSKIKADKENKKPFGSLLKSGKHRNIPKSRPTVVLKEDLRSSADKAGNIIHDFSIAKLMGQKMNKVAHTSSQLRQISQAILETVRQIEIGESSLEKIYVDDIFEKAYQMDEKGQLFYHHVKKLFKQKMVGKTIKPESRSRIYNTITVIKKCYEIDETEENDFDIKVRRTNGYNELSSEQMEEVIELEALGWKVKQLGIKMNMKYRSIEKESENIMNLLAKCFNKYQKELKNLKNDLSDDEVMLVAEIARDACNYHDNGVVILLIYLVRACRNLESSKTSVKQIEAKVQKVFKQISKKYPPGQGLSNSQKILESALERINHKEQFEHKSQQFVSNDKKQEQLQNIIINYAMKAKQNRDNFQQLIRKSCLQHSIQTKIGLKLYPDNPSKKAMIRIIEKMLFSKQQIIEKQAKSSIDETLKSEDDQYKKKIDSLLKAKQKVQMTISDMVRGKCIFLEINDIIETIEKIKNFVKNDPTKRFRITQIESRFTKNIPISDVTLKIAINQELLAELQLTVQANAAAYNFAHKIYELQRTKFFSKLKIVNNYFQQFQGDFKELVSKAIELSCQQISKLSKEDRQKLSKQYISQESMSPQQRYYLISLRADSINKYMDLSKTKVMDYEQIIQKTMEKFDQANKFPFLYLSVSKSLQGLMLPVFKMEMGIWYQQLGQQINSVLESQQKHSNLLKATLMYFFFKKFDLSKEVTSMLHFWAKYFDLASHIGYTWKTKISQGKQYMKFYLAQAFSIKQPFDYSCYTPKAFYKIQQAKQLCVQRQTMTKPSLFVINRYVLGNIIEQNSNGTVKTMKEYMDSLYNSTQESRLNEKYFKYYYSWLMSILKQYPELNTGLVKCYAQFLAANLLLAAEKYRQAQHLLEKVSIQFKDKEQHEKWLECQLFLTECYVHKTKSLEAIKERYRKEVEEKSKGLGLEMRGKEVAKSEWRIYQMLLKRGVSREQKLYIEQTHLKKALTQSSRTQSKNFIKKMYDAYAEKDRYVLTEYLFAFQRNENVKFISFNDNDTKRIPNPQFRCRVLSKTKWPNLTTLYLQNNRIEPSSCALLSKAQWANLTTLNLRSNNVGDEGCKHLSKANWPNLSTLLLSQNSIGNQGCQFLSLAKWPNLTILNLSDNWVSATGCAHLCKAQLSKLVTLNLEWNNIPKEEREKWQAELQKMAPKASILT